MKDLENHVVSPERAAGALSSTSSHTPGPWAWHDVAGAGLQISAVLPAGFKFDGTAREFDGKTSLMTWTVRDKITVQIADERWVQFSTGSWDEMQRANARLITAAPDLLAALEDADNLLCGNDYGPHSHIRRTIAAALAKAKGVENV